MFWICWVLKGVTVSSYLGLSGLDTMPDAFMRLMQYPYVYTSYRRESVNLVVCMP